MRMSLGRVTALAAVPVLLLAMGAGTASARPASGSPPPPAGFEADSASFVSPQTGFVLGARHCGFLPCKALLAKTVNGARTWTSVAAPAPGGHPVSLVPPFTATPSNAVSTVRFENANDGWLFNPGLWATTDGGKHWRFVSLPGVVTALAASDGVVFASVEPPNGSSLAAKLYRNVVGSGKWSLVPGVAPQNNLTVFGHSAWTGAAPRMWTTVNGGKTWITLSYKQFHCPSAYPAPSAVAAASPKNVAIACSDLAFPAPGHSVKAVFVSSDGGLKWAQVRGYPGNAGETGLIAMPVDNPKVITLTASSGASYIYRTASSGKTWAQETFSDGGLGFRDLAYVNGQVGYLVHFGGSPALAYGLGLMKTVNAGASWTPVTIR